MEVSCGHCHHIYKTKADLIAGTSQWRHSDDGSLFFLCQCAHTVQLKAGTFDWYTPEMFMSPPTQKAFQQIRGILKLPSIPATVIELQVLLEDAESPVSALASALKRAPFIAADFLQMASLRAIGTGQRIESLEHAIVFVGRKALADMASSATLGSFSFATKLYTPEEYWYDGFLCGLITEHVVKKFKITTDPGEAYLAACLCNLGKLVGAMCFPNEIDRIYASVTAPKTARPWIVAEREMKVISHEHLGEMAAVLWGLPSYVVHTTLEHHAPKRHANKNVTDLQLGEAVSFANQLTHWTKLEPFLMDEKLVDGLKQRFGFDDQALESFVEELKPIKVELDRQLKQTIYTYLKFKTDKVKVSKAG